MFQNLFWLCLGSGLTLVSNLALSHKLSISDFGLVTGLFALCSFLAVLCARGQQGLILSRAPNIDPHTIKHAFGRIAPVFIIVITSTFVYFAISFEFRSQALVALLPFVVLSILSQVMMGVSQANVQINRIGLFQTLPSLGRSLPAFFWIAVAYFGDGSASLIEYFLYTSAFCLAISIFIVFIDSYKQPTRQTTKTLCALSTKKESAFWLSAILSSSYVGLMAPLILYLWGDEAAGAFGIYLLLWGVTNIIISSIFNNYLLPKYAAIRQDPVPLALLLKRSRFFALWTSLAIGFLCTAFVEIGLNYIWPAEYLRHESSFFICIASLMIRPFSASIGLSLNFPDKVAKKNKIQIASIAFLVGSTFILSPFKSFSLLSFGIVVSELIVLINYYYYRDKL